MNIGLTSLHLREALRRGPSGPPLKPTSVPIVITLEEILTRAQNRLRPQEPQRQSWLSRFLAWIR